MLMLLTSGKDDHAEQADVCEPQLHAWCVFVCCIFDILSTSEKERIYNFIVRIYASYRSVKITFTETVTVANSHCGSLGLGSELEGAAVAVAIAREWFYEPVTSPMDGHWSSQGCKSLVY